MAVVNSNAIASRLPIPGEGAGGGNVKTQKCIVAATVGLTTTDTMPLFYLPANALVLGLIVKSDALGGATTLNIGDNGIAVAADVDRYLVANNITTAGGVVTTMAATGVFFRTGATANRLLVTAAFAAGTVAAAGNIEVAIYYTVEEPQL